MDWKVAEKTKENSWKVPDSWLHIYYYEALTILFRFENSLRVFVYAILKNQLFDKWTEAVISNEGDKQITIKSASKKRIAQYKIYGYLGHEISSPIMHLTSGELISLIMSTSYWSHFNDYFRGDKEIIKNKLLEVGSIRNALAHFRPIKQEDVEVAKINTNQTLMEIEPFLNNLISFSKIVPTNTEDDWYRELSSIQSDHFVIELKQSDDDDWISISMTYKSKIVQFKKVYEKYYTYGVLNLISQSLLTDNAELTKYITYLSEHVPYTTMPDDGKPKFKKTLNLVFRKEVITANYLVIAKGINNVVSEVSRECALVEKDNLARGKYVYLISTRAFYKEDKEYAHWDVGTKALLCKVKSDDPTEYWGDLEYSTNFVTSNPKYPWMPTDISNDELPF